MALILMLIQVRSRTIAHSAETTVLRRLEGFALDTTDSVYCSIAVWAYTLALGDSRVDVPLTLVGHVYLGQMSPSLIHEPRRHMFIIPFIIDYFDVFSGLPARGSPLASSSFIRVLYCRGLSKVGSCF